MTEGWNSYDVKCNLKKLQRKLTSSVTAISSRRPLFASVTWHNSHTIASKGSKSEIDHPALELAHELQNKHNVTTCLHLAAGDLTKEQVLFVLNRALRMGVRNIFALRGGKYKLHTIGMAKNVRTNG